MKLTIISAFLLMTTYALADGEQTSPAVNGQYQRLELKDAQPIKMSPDEAEEAKRQAIQNFNDNLQKSDPETQSAIRKAMENIQRTPAASTAGDENPSSN